MDWLDAVTATLAIVAVPLALRKFLRKVSDTNDPNDTNDTNDDTACDCLPVTRQFPQDKEPTSERQPESP